VATHYGKPRTLVAIEDEKMIKREACNFKGYQAHMPHLYTDMKKAAEGHANRRYNNFMNAQNIVHIKLTKKGQDLVFSRCSSMNIGVNMVAAREFICMHLHISMQKQ
jgi:hypothetical protein